MSCDTCHGNFASFSQFTCLNCHGHEQPLTEELHRNLVAVGSAMSDGGTGFVYSGTSCLQCHASGTRVPFDHAGVTWACAQCHDTGAPFDALPVAGVGLDGGAFVHPDQAGNDCQACHTIASWTGATGAPEGMRDPAQDVLVTAQIPTVAGTSITTFTAQIEALPMPMFHRSGTVTASVPCITCHVNANAGGFFPGLLHPSLTAPPATCLDCHATSVPGGFVGPMATSPPRTPPSPEMRHDAVLWSNGVRTATPAVPQECSLCHQAPPASPTWATSQKFHASLAAGLQPSSCLDCHANSRPAVPLTSASAALPAGVQFDHTGGPASGECTTCHAGGATQFTSWSGGRFHLPGSATPSTCLPCHQGERPSFAGTPTPPWISPTYPSSPFDYGGYDNPPISFTHGDGQDCAACHANPGLAPAVWGGTGAQKPNWAKGSFNHAAASSAASSTCVACHSTQRPASPVPYKGTTFDHSQNGTGDCLGCHQATVTVGKYVNYPGDWAGGVGYPGSTLVSAPTQFITVTETTLTPAPPSLVTGTSSITATLHNAMLHDDAAVLPALLYPGPTSNPDYTKCYRCHTSSNAATGAPYANGQFHSVLTSLPAPQPTVLCADCHSQMRPAGIVSKSGLNLQPMDHDAAFASAATVTSNGVPISVTNVNQIDCSSCHKSPGSTWTDGVFHQNIGAAVPADCTVCHYPLMADSTNADPTSAALYAMRHRSTQVAFQNCQFCHASALSKGKATPIAAALWKPGAFHASVAPQPVACNDCHAVSMPASGASTQSSVSYYLPAGGTSTNAAQWMNHGSPSVVGKDCAVCHARDARTSGSAWSKSDSFHGPVTSPASCQECHGVTNGGGAAMGTNNNLPVGLTNSSMVTSAASDSTTGIAVGTLDQITHADINVSGHDCNFCHTQKGVSTVSGVQGKEWAQASFHASFSSAKPLVMNGTTGRCSDCHMNVKPTAGFPGYDHSGLSAAAGTQDCNSCHSWPGTGTASSPNWLGASAAPLVVTLTGWTSGSVITSNTVTFAHPRPSTYTSCAQCHAGSNTSTIVDYNHDGLQSNVTINGVAVSPAPNLGTSQYNVSTNPTFCVACHNSKSPWINRSTSSTITADTTSGSTTVSTPSASALTLGMTVTGTGIPNATTTTTSFTGTITTGSTTVTTASPVSFRAGTVISGVGVPANDTVATSVTNATSFTLTAAATASTTETLTATTSSPLTVTIKSIPTASTFVVSSPANATLTGTTLTVTHMSIKQVSIGSHGGSNSSQDCTSCHYVGGNERLTPPTAGVFGTGAISGN